MADEKKERWIQGVALSTTLLAVCAAIGSLKGGAYSTRVQLGTTQESSRWSYYQAKSTKQHLVEQEAREMELTALSTQSREARRFAEARREAALGEAKRYEAEKGVIKAEAEGIQAEEAVNKRHAGAFGQAVMLLQIAITLSSVGALIKRPPMWWAGLAFGAVGLVYLLDGFVLWF